MRFATWLRRPIVWLPISVGLLGLLIWRTRPWDALALRAVDPAPLLAAAALSAVVAVLWALRSAALLRAAGRPVAVAPLVPMTAFANTINNLTPGSAGEVVRMYLLRAHHRVDYATSGAVIVVERVGAIGYLSTSAILAWLTWLGVMPGWLALVVAASLAVGPGLVYRTNLRPLVVVRALPLGRLVGADRWARLADWLRRVDDTVAGLLGRPGPLASFVVTTAAIFAAYTAQLLLVGRALGVTMDPLAAWGALGIATTIGVLSLLPFGLGTTDLSLAALLGVAGVPAGAAVAVSLGYRLVSTLPLGIAGVASYAWLSTRLPGAGVGEATRAIGSTLDDADPIPER